MNKNIIKTIGTANANALTFNVVIKQKSINEKDGIKLTTNFKANFVVNANRYLTMGKTLSRIVKALNFQIVQGKQSGSLKGLNLRYPFMFEVSHGDVVVFKSTEVEYNAKGGLTEKSQNRFFRNVAKQYVKSIAETTEWYLNGDEDDSTFTTEADAKMYRELLDLNICEAVELIA